jgi:tetratricopeptide (TPR) repeat protein
MAQTPPQTPPEPEERQLPPPAPDERLPFPPPPAFTGRAAELAKLIQHLDPNQTVPPGPRLAAITGWDGLGKTSLALKFCTLNHASFNSIHWLSARTPLGLEGGLHPARASLRTQIAASGAAQGLKQTDLNDLVGATYRAWNEEPAPLIVFDDLEHPGLLETILPQLPAHARVLITTTWQNWPANLGVQTLPLDALPRADSLALLLRLAPDLSPDACRDLDPLARGLGDVPLALDLAGRLLHLDTKMTPARLSAALENALSHNGQGPATSLGQARRSGAADYSQSLEPLLRLTWRGLHWLDHRDGVARAVMTLAAHAAPGSVLPNPVLENALHQARRSARPTLAAAWLWEWATHSQHEEGLADILGRLEALGLLRRASGGAVVHPLAARLVQRFTGETAAPLAASPFVDLARSLVEATASLPFGSPTNNAISLGFRPHLIHASARADKDELEQAPQLWANLGSHYHATGETEQARLCMMRAIRGLEARHGKGHLALVPLLTRLAEILHSAHDRAGERQAYERALAIVEKNHGFYHVETAEQAAQLGRALLESGDALAARPFLERALRIYENQPNPDPLSLSALYYNLGLTWQSIGELVAARESLEISLRLAAENLGPDDEKTALRHISLGAVLWALGDLPGARTHCALGLEALEALRGPADLLVSETRRRLAHIEAALAD